MRRRLVAALAVVLVAALVTGLWIAADWPPPRLLVTYGPRPVGGPTGRRRTVCGISLVELSAGCYRMGTHEWCENGDLVGRICRPLGLPWGTRPRHGGPACPTRWVEIPRPIWVATEEVSNFALARLDPDWRPSFRDAGAWDAAVGVTFERADAFCRRLTEHGEGLVFRLPTEEEWEYAARGNEGGFEGRRADYAWGLWGFASGAAEWCVGRSDHPARVLRGIDAGLVFGLGSPGPVWRGHLVVDGIRPGEHFLDAGFRPVAVEGGTAPPPPPEPRFPLDRWALLASGEMVEVHVERAVYEREGSGQALLRLAASNRTDRAIGVDFRWHAPHPDGSRHRDRGRAALLDDFRAGKLATAPPRGTIDCWSTFDGRLPEEADRSSTDFDGWIFGAVRATDGKSVEGMQVLLERVLLPAPVLRKRLPAGARVVEAR